jgi:large subunit ribosomal protein L9
MKVILLKDIPKVGRKGEIKEVADGHALNFLIPRRLAEKATDEKIKSVENIKKSREEASKENLEQNHKILDSLSGKKIILKARANTKGHLYREIHEKDIVSAINEQLKLNIKEDWIKIDAHYKELGVFKVKAAAGQKIVEFELEIGSI